MISKMKEWNLMKVTAFLCLACGVAELSVSPANAACEDPMLNTGQRTACYVEEYRNSESVVSEKFKEVIVGATSSVDRELLRRSQTAWQIYVSEQCKLESALVHGSASGFAEYICLNEQYTARLQYLNETLLTLREYETWKRNATPRLRKHLDQKHKRGRINIKAKASGAARRTR